MTLKTTVPFLDLVAPHRELEEELVQVFRMALGTAQFIGGPMVQRFQDDFAAFCGVDHCMGVASGTDALRFALMATGLEKGSIVVTVPNTFIATTEAITQAGGTIRFVDVDPQSCNMDPQRLGDYLEEFCSEDGSTGRLHEKSTGIPVHGIVPVHLYGQTADMDPILDLTARWNLAVVEDACQAHGAQYHSRRHNRWFTAGSMGDAAAFSFYPGKNLGACGEGGAVTTNSEKLANHVATLRDHGQATKYYHRMEGYNGRLDAIQAGFLSVKLKHLAAWNEQRRRAAESYHELLSRIPEITLPLEPSWSRGVYHLYVIQTPWRDELMQTLQGESIQTGLHYPLPLHRQEAYRLYPFSQSSFPAAEKAAAQILSLPMSPQLTVEQQQKVADTISRFFSALSAPSAVKSSRA